MLASEAIEKWINRKVLRLRRCRAALAEKPIDLEEMFGLVARLIGGVSQ
jgi:hypothetical protein